MWLRSIILFVIEGLWYQNDTLEMRKGTKKRVCRERSTHSPNFAMDQPPLVCETTNKIYSFCGMLFYLYTLLYALFQIPIDPLCRLPAAGHGAYHE